MILPPHPHHDGGDQDHQHGDGHAPAGALKFVHRESLVSLGEPIKIIVTRFQCPHCKRTRASRKGTERHIARCYRNPAVRSCKTCEHHCRATMPEFEDRHYYPGDPEGCALGLEVLQDGTLRRDCESWAARVTP